MRGMTSIMLLTLAACLPLTVVGQHTSENSLDWDGVYQGILPCADCQGIETTLRLSRDGTYELSRKYLGKSTTPFTSIGTFEWRPDGRAIMLKTSEGTQFYRVEENRLRQLDTRGQPIKSAQGDKVADKVPDNYVLKKLPENMRPQQAMLVGTATYRERMALPPNAVFEATLEDISRVDAPAEVLGRVRLETPGNPPIKFTIPYDASRVDPRHRYAVRARIVAGDALLFTTDSSHPALTADHPAELNLLLRRASAASARGSTATLENTYWKLMQLGAAPVAVGENQPEPHLILHPADKRVSGSGGCNRLMGSYTLDGNGLTFSQMAGTMMACLSGMEQEQSFHDALSRAATWRIQGEMLELSDASGAVIAQFESRHMK